MEAQARSLRRNVEKHSEMMACLLFIEMCRDKFPGPDANEKMRGAFRERIRGTVEELHDFDILLNTLSVDEARELSRIKKYTWDNVVQVIEFEKILFVFDSVELPIFPV